MKSGQQVMHTNTCRKITLLAAGMLLFAGSRAIALKEMLLDVTKGQVPTDTTGKTKFVIEPCKEMGGMALKVVLSAGESFGVLLNKSQDWKPFAMLEFEAFNPSADKVRLTLSLNHKQTTSFQKRADVPITLVPGRNTVRIPLAEIRNVNGSVPDLASVARWYLKREGGASSILFFGNICLTDENRIGPAVLPPAAPPATYRIKGKIGDMPVDLIITPEAEASPTNPPASSTNQSTTNRLGRIQPGGATQVAQALPDKQIEALKRVMAFVPAHVR